MRKVHFVILFLLSQISVFSNKANHQEFTLNDTSIIKKQLSIAKNYHSNPDSALIYYSTALEIAKKINAGKFTALCYKYIGTSYYYKSDFNNALIYWEKSLQEYKSIGDKKGTATVLGNLGIIYQYQSNYQRTIETIQEALSIYKEINDKNGIARNLTQLGIMCEYQGEYVKALEYYQKAIQINEETENIDGIASNYSNMGIVYKTQEEYDKALEYYFKAIEIRKQQDDKIKLARNYINIGIIYSIQSNYQGALDFYNKALEINKLFGDRNIIASNLENIGIIHDYQKNYDLALDYYKRALRINQEIGNKRSIANNLVNISSILYKKEDFNQTIAYASKALAISAEIGDLNLERNIYQNLSEAYESLMNYPKAIEYKNLWMKLNDSIFNIEKTKAIADIQTKYETEKKDQEINTLQKDNEIQQLQLEETRQRTKAQRWLLLALAFILLSIVLVIWFVYKNYKKQQTINQQKLQYQKVITEQKMLRLQMNPHFIFNSLNSIQSFISSEQSYEAEKYLARFAKLIRGILENSRENLISLDKEIEVLELYLSLEQLRFENRFSYKINIDEKLEQDFTSIPPMLVQPFAENAILHGLKNKKDGKLNINFLEKDDSLICEIDDNGIGREASTGKNTQKNHKSLATTITKDRLKALSDEFHKPSHFSIEDKKDQDTNAAIGTKVTIQIPIIEN